MKWEKWKEIRWDELRELNVYSLGMSFDFFNFLLHTAISIWFQLISSMSLHYLIFAIVFTQYAVPFIPLIAVFFDFLSILFISFPFEYICLLYFNFSFSLQMIKPSRMIRESKQNYGPQSTFSYLNCFIINDTEIIHNHQISLHDWYVF